MSMSYFDFFDKIFYDKNDNHVFFCEDRSSKKVPQKALTKEEKREREEWKNILEKLRKHYKNKEVPQVKTTEDLMEMRLLPPRLEDEKGVTSRTADKELRIRLHPKPKQVVAWDGFHEQVCRYSPPKRKLEDRNQFGGLFQQALNRSARKSYNSEKGEERYLLRYLEDTLVESTIINDIKYEEEGRGLQGKPDFTLWVNSRKGKPILAVVGESKSTHNLLLPNDNRALLSKYRAAYKTVVENERKQTTEWCHIAHPVAQLLTYMVDNGRRYGALTSATRTYFLFLEGNGNNMKVKVSDAYLSGEETYLRAWSSIASLGAAQKGTFVAPSGWVRSDKDTPTPDGKNKGKGGGSRAKPEAHTNQKKRGRSEQSGRVPSKKNKGKTASLVLKQVSFQDLELGGEIGFGRNGSVFEVQWMNRRCALKQYDLGKGGYEAYHKELAAYTRLKDEWGRLVPEPLFVSKSLSGGILYLGLELGQDPSSCDYASKEWSSLLHKLENIYGIRRHDSINCNGLIITRDGRDRMVAIDFEDWSDLTV